MRAFIERGDQARRVARGEGRKEGGMNARSHRSVSPAQLERCNWANRISRHVQPLTKLLYTRSGGALIGPSLYFVSLTGLPISREKPARK